MSDSNILPEGTRGAGSHPRLDMDTSSITLDEPDLAQMRQDRMDRNLATMKVHSFHNKYMYSKLTTCTWTKH